MTQRRAQKKGYTVASGKVCRRPGGASRRLARERGLRLRFWNCPRTVLIIPPHLFVLTTPCGLLHLGWVNQPRILWLGGFARSPLCILGYMPSGSIFRFQQTKFRIF